MIVRIRSGAKNIETYANEGAESYQVLALEQRDGDWGVTIERAIMGYPVTIPLSDCELVSGSISPAWHVAQRGNLLAFGPDEILHNEYFGFS
jgi:hypothetical protein